MMRVFYPVTDREWRVILRHPFRFIAEQAAAWFILSTLIEQTWYCLGLLWDRLV